MDKLEYHEHYFLIIGLIAFVSWAISFYYLFKRRQFSFHSKSVKSKGIFVRSIIFFIGVVGWTYLCYSLLFPRIPLGSTDNEIEVNDIFLVVDVSRSMLAEDFNPNRLEAAKKKILDFVELRPKDRIGIIIFSEKVFTLLPLTRDLELIRKMVEEIGIGPLGSGTNIGDAIGLAVARGIQSQAKNKIIILFTDGVSNVGNLTPIQAAEQAKDAAIKVYTIGIGGDKDARIPVGQGFFGTRYQSIPGGSIDIEGLRQISEITGAKSYLAKDEKSLENVLSEIEKLERTKITIHGKKIYQELYLKYFIIGLLLIFLSEAGRRFILREVL